MTTPYSLLCTSLWWGCVTVRLRRRLRLLGAPEPLFYPFPLQALHQGVPCRISCRDVQPLTLSYTKVYLTHIRHKNYAAPFLFPKGKDMSKTEDHMFIFRPAAGLFTNRCVVISSQFLLPFLKHGKNLFLCCPLKILKERYRPLSPDPPFHPIPPNPPIALPTVPPTWPWCSP